MKLKIQAFAVLLGLWVLAVPLSAASKESLANIAESDKNFVLWREPTDIVSRDLFYGSGGKEHAPSGVFTFVKEDREASNPKFTIRDENGVEWKVKLGGEVHSETAATRLVWAVGYSTDEDYFVPILHVTNMPRLRRGQNLVASDGSIPNARLERKLKGEDKGGIWKWRRSGMRGSRELDGLRVMMALINNWDLKDVNNAVYSTDNGKVYLVSDLGASFGSPGFSFPVKKSRSNLESYSHSKFIGSVKADRVDFRTPARPALIRIFAVPDFIGRLRMRSIGRDVPRDHVKWIGQILGRLSPEQIRSAFRAAGYSSGEVEGFAKVVETRIAQLNEL
jgi:hypothetical protein